MKYLISLPAPTVPVFYKLAGKPEESWFCTSDPADKKVGSGGGTAWLLTQSWKESGTKLVFKEWLKSEKRILIHGGGQSRRLPSYAPMGKLLIPVPVFRWERGQRLNQTLLDLQQPLLEKLIHAAPGKTHTLLASGDALILSDVNFDNLPDVDVISFGLSVDPSLSSRHGVFICPRNNSETLEYMLQKPSVDTLRNLAVDYLFFIDVGIWLLSDRAIDVLMKKCGWNPETDRYSNNFPDMYDFYGSFGLTLGRNPKNIDPDTSVLTTSIIQLTGGEFYHFGTSKEIISSSLSLQNKVNDQRQIWTRNVKPRPSMFVQNTLIDIPLNESQGNLWIENSHINKDWKIAGNQIITGIPENKWNISLPEGICLDVSPIGKNKYAIRPYGIDDVFKGALFNSETIWMNAPFKVWLEDRRLNLDQCTLNGETDIYFAPLFPAVSLDDTVEVLIDWMISGEGHGKDIWLNADRLSASQISSIVNLDRLEKQRITFRSKNWLILAKNYNRSVFFQVDLDHGAKEFALNNIPLPDSLPGTEDTLYRAYENMFHSRVKRYRGKSGEEERKQAFEILQQGILESIIGQKVTPVKDVYEDQIVWARSPVRIDLAGGWTDTPPYSVLEGGKVVNISLELNGQPPLQAFIRPSLEKVITLRSIDLGKREVVTSYEELTGYNRVGSPFSIPKAALCLSGFMPSFSARRFPDLKTQLKDFGSGIEISFLAAIPKGSGMGTSSILAATILGALSDFCKLDWDDFEICNRTLALEQLLTTGGGWQDQYGGIISSVKLLETERGWNQTPRIRWLPDRLFIEPEYHASQLLYYTGITRVAKNLLAEIVEGMFLNEHDRFSVLKELKRHAIDTWEAIQQGDYEAYGRKIARSWELNNLLDSGTSNPEIESIIGQIDDLSIGYKLPGAGGGGYLYIAAKDPEAARLIRRRLEENPPNPRARFVDMSISGKGMQISRS